MRSWKTVDADVCSLAGLERKFNRACGRKNVSGTDRKHFKIVSAQYRTDGYTTQTEVVVEEGGLIAALNSPIIATGYGAAVRSITDKFSEQRGVSESLNRAFEGAATVIRHKLINRANRRK